MREVVRRGAEGGSEEGGVYVYQSEKCGKNAVDLHLHVTTSNRHLRLTLNVY